MRTVSGPRTGRRRTVLVGLAALVLLGGLRLAEPTLFVTLRDRAFDIYQRLSPRPYEPAPVRIVDIDDASLEEFGQWPWPRDRMAELVTRLQKMGAAAIALDILFAEPDRASPHLLEDRLPSFGIAVPAGARLPNNDRLFAEALARGPTVTGFALTSRESGETPLVKSGFALLGERPAASLPDFPGASVALPAFQEAAAGNGNFAIAAADARTVRALPLLARHQGAIVSSLALEALRVAQGAGTIAIKSADAGASRLSSASRLTIKVGALTVPLEADGTYPLHFTEGVPERYVSARRILNGDAGAALAERIRGHIVLIGTSAVGLSDLRATPLNPFEPGVAIHAAAIEQIVLGHHLQRPYWAPGAELLAGLAAGLMVLGLVAFTPVGLSAPASAMLLVGTAWGGLHLFATHRLLLDPVPVLLAVALVFVAAILARIVFSEGEKRRLRHAFAHYLSPDMVKAIAARPDRLKLGGETREMTFLFTDLEGFTSFTETSEPEVLVEVLNAYLAEMCALVTAHGGTIDKIVGDAVHAMFNAPLDQEDHADRAVACALAIRAFSEAFARRQAASGRRIGVTRIGVNTGPAVVGNFGGAGRFDYTAHGDAINTAARLEAANKALGTRICVAASTASRCARHRFRPIGTLMLKGKTQGVEALEPLEPSAEEPSAYRSAFAALLAGGAERGAAMAAYAARHPGDALGRLHAARIARGEAGALITLG